jgi:hypothetical protein
MKALLDVFGDTLVSLGKTNPKVLVLDEILSEHLPKRVVRFGIEDRWGESAPNDFLLDQFQLSGLRLSEKIAKRLKRTQP